MLIKYLKSLKNSYFKLKGPIKINYFLFQSKNDVNMGYTAVFHIHLLSAAYNLHYCNSIKDIDQRCAS